ncbi:50S ribosomal protein L3 [Coxiella endosymbiont of Amblyomma nuttalli]|uniref:50S ribosomal protein L3 n=1 Tax=Coxiella endosymbiont of Amblyomma nuttalli TaxID=2749996 RepID=UPI001BAE4C81|nr:50S ribosomal protein L3 [Coxiella endosymbiont of Amblyomma nuttalli]QTS83791.1 50S ribosomal protein L3 [Coxiella endosymbiont of Amblyomma nuttalli]
MSIGLIGRKCGMTRIFTETGVSVPITVVEVMPNRIAQLKILGNDGYRALQMTRGIKTTFTINKAIAGHYARAGIEVGDGLYEIRLKDDELTDVKVGDELKVDLFKENQKVDVRGLTRGKGFAGTVKRHNFQTQDATHGNSLSHRAPGSIGQCQSPGRVWKGKRMPGHMGSVYRTVQNQEIVKIDLKRHLLLIKGAIPGAPNGKVMITKSNKKKCRGN